MTERQLLVIDDDPGFSEIVRTVAEGLNFSVKVTQRAEHFKAAYLEAPPDVIVLDIVMPEVDGIEMMKWLAEQGCRASVIIVSGYDQSYARAAKAIALADNEMTVQTLEKPVKLAVLREALTAPRP